MINKIISLVRKRPRTRLYIYSRVEEVARASLELARMMGNAEIVPISTAVDEPLDLSAERVGIIYPVYRWGMPSVVAEFLKRFKAAAGSSFFAVALCGDQGAGSLSKVSSQLRSRGMELSAGFLVRNADIYS